MMTEELGTSLLVPGSFLNLMVYWFVGFIVKSGGKIGLLSRVGANLIILEPIFPKILIIQQKFDYQNVLTYDTITIKVLPGGYETPKFNKYERRTF